MTPRTPAVSNSILQLTATLRDIDPPIWRRLLVREDITLTQLHLTLQEVFGWENYHLYQFTVRGQEFDTPGEGATGRNATKTTLKALKLQPGDRFDYWYDFGDDWQCEVVVEEAQEAAKDGSYPSCVGGARAGPPEDSGGPPGYQELLEVLAKPKHPRYRGMRDWIEPGFDPEAFDQRATNRLLRRLFSAAQSNKRLKLASDDE
jgi:hypothetical protein